MNISTNTLNVLKSFTSINPSIYVNSGNVVKTISPQKTIIARAEVEETFATAFGIYDLNQFISTVSIFDSPEFEFGDKSVTINGGPSSVNYFYADSNMIMQAPDKDLDLPDCVVEFELKDEVRGKSMQAASVLQLPNWSVVGDSKNITLEVGNTKDDSSNVFRHVVGETDAEFELTFKVENLRFMPADYNVKISSKGISHFSANGGKLQYYIATESR
tara:strand:+ start:672 stop:1322 length:651 start_codon:yes stop_codon:yes gene_type:complete